MLAVLFCALAARAQGYQVGAPVFYTGGSIDVTYLTSFTASGVSGLEISTAAFPGAQTEALFVGAFYGTYPNWQYASTGLTSGSYLPGTRPVVQTAAVIFGPNETAQIGFAAPGSATPASFLDYPFRISLTHVWNGGIGTVPEPPTWMLTLVGLMAAGAMWRRRMR